MKQNLSSLINTLHNDKKECEMKVRIYQEALNMIAEYIDSPDVDIGLTEYSNIHRIIEQVKGEDYEY